MGVWVMMNGIDHQQPKNIMVSFPRSLDISTAKYISILNIFLGEVDPTQVGRSVAAYVCDAMTSSPRHTHSLLKKEASQQKKVKVGGARGVQRGARHGRHGR